ncbi:MAG: RDD family protein [Desulfuromonadaceae bacterium]|nr:RDD family protein [Desulfuromonadaceae bacterium]
MRCPHCGYNTFAHLENCKKCGRELKQTSAESETFAEVAPLRATPPTTGEDDRTVEARVNVPTAEGVDGAGKGEFVAHAVETEGGEAIAISAAAHREGFDAASAKFAPSPYPVDIFSDVQPTREFPAFDLLPEEPLPPVKSFVSQERTIVGRRVLASVLDIAAILTCWLLFYAWGHALLWEGVSGFFAPLEHSPGARGGFYLLLVLIALGYHVLFYYINGQTPGKMVTKIKVVSCNAEPLTLTQVMLRICGGFVSALLLGAGYLAIWWARDMRSWNDKLADTQVELTRAENISAERYAAEQCE